MADVVRQPRVRRGDDAVVNDVQKALQDLVKALNDGPLSLDSIARFHATVFDKSWVALGATLTRAPIHRVRSSSRLLGASFTCANALAAHAVDYRTITVERVRAGAFVPVAQKDTKSYSISAHKPFELDLSGDVNTELEDGDAVVLTLSGGGSLPALTSGVLELYVERTG